MNKLYFWGIFSAILTLPNISSAQPIASANSASATKVESNEQARKEQIILLNTLRDFSNSADNSSTRTNTFSDNSLEVASKSVTGNSALEYKLFLDKMGSAFNRRLESLSGRSVKTELERSYLNSGMTLFKSATCFAKDGGKSNYMTVKTVEGFEVLGYSLDSLRRNSRFGLVENYKEGFARIRKDQVYGFLNLCGDEIITPQYERAEPFNNGKAVVKRVDWFFVNTEGEEGDPLEKVTDAKAMMNGITMVKLSSLKQAFIDNNYDQSKTFLSQLYDGIEPFYKGMVFKIRQGKKVGLMGLDGKEILSATYDAIDSTNMEGVYRVTQGVLSGLLDTSWQLKVPIMIQNMSEFNQFGLSIMNTDKGIVVLNRKGFAMSAAYSSIGSFNEFGIAIVRDQSNLYGLMNTKMEITVTPKYASISDFNEMGLASACLSGGKCGFIHHSGREQIKMTYESVGSFNKFGLAAVRVKVPDCGKPNEPCIGEIVIDQDGNTIVPVTGESTEKNYRYTLTDSLFSGNFMIVNLASKDGNAKMLINRSTLKLITPAPYENVTALDILGNFRIRNNGVWGIMDSTGKILIKPQFKEIMRQNDEYYPTKNDKDKWGYLNRKGRAQIPFEYEEVLPYFNGLAIVSKGKGRLGIINRFNGKIAPCVFKTIEINDKNLDYEMKDGDDTTILMDKEGNCKTNCVKLEAYRAKANKEEAAAGKK